MAFTTEGRDNRIYLAVAVFIVVVIIFTIFLSSNQLFSAKIQDEFLGKSWIEDISERDAGSGFLGLEKWSSFSYKNNDKNYPAYVTVNTFKTLFMVSEEELKNKMEQTITDSFEQNVTVDLKTKIDGGRTLGNGHKTLYIIYDGNFSNGQVNEKIKIICETWNCGVSGTSIICIGYAQLTDNAHNDPEINNTYWIKILKDEQGTFGLEYKADDGLIYNVQCH